MPARSIWRQPAGILWERCKFVAVNFESLKRYAETHAPNFGETDTDSVLEMLYDYYKEFNTYESGAIKDGFNALYERLEYLPLKELDKVIYVVCDLCIAHERAAFVEGTKVGVHLGMELVG